MDDLLAKLRAGPTGNSEQDRATMHRTAFDHLIGASVGASKTKRILSLTPLPRRCSDLWWSFVRCGTCAPV